MRMLPVADGPAKLHAMWRAASWRGADGRAALLLLLLLAPATVFAKKGILIVFLCLVLAGASFESVRAVWRQAPAAVAGLAVIGLWSFASLGFAPAPGILDAVRHMSMLPLGLLWIGAALTARNPDRAGRVLAVSVAAMAALYLFEVLSGAALTRLFHPAGFTQDVKMYEKVAGGMVLMTALVWPVSARIAAWHWWAGIALIVSAGAVSLILPMAAAALAMLTGAAVFLLALWLPRTALAAIAICFVVYALSAPMLSRNILTIQNARDAGLHMPSGWEHRLGIWHYASGKMQPHLLRGAGFDASRYFGDTDDVIREIVSPDGAYAPALPLHPHNGVIQLWLELGLPGIVGICLVLAGLCRAIWRAQLTRLARAGAAATLTAALIPFLISFGVWQSWWMATLFVVVGGTVLLLRSPETPAQSSSKASL
jgi:exopolysaccharide production protein ExoQ